MRMARPVGGERESERKREREREEEARAMLKRRARPLLKLNLLYSCDRYEDVFIKFPLSMPMPVGTLTQNESFRRLCVIDVHADDA